MKAAATAAVALAWSIALLFPAGACWLPVVWIQMRMRDVARAAVAAGISALPALVVALGVVAFVSLIVVFY